MSTAWNVKVTEIASRGITLKELLHFYRFPATNELDCDTSCKAWKHTTVAELRSVEGRHATLQSNCAHHQ